MITYLKKLVEKSIKIGNSVYEFIAYYYLCKTYLKQKNFIKIQKILLKAQKVGFKLNNIKINDFIKLAIVLNEMNLTNDE